MTVYLALHDVNSYRWCSAPEEWVADHLLFFGGESRANVWDPPTMAVHKPERPSPDFMAVNFSGDPIVTYAGRALLEEVLDGDVEMLPLLPPLHRCSYANITRLVDCLDEEATDFNVGPSGRRGTIFRFAFRDEELVGQRGPFKLPQMPDTVLFATDQFRVTYENSNLTGLTFEPVFTV